MGDKPKVLVVDDEASPLALARLLFESGNEAIESERDVLRAEVEALTLQRLRMEADSNDAIVRLGQAEGDRAALRARVAELERALRGLTNAAFDIRRRGVTGIARNAEERELDAQLERAALAGYER